MEYVFYKKLISRFSFQLLLTGTHVGPETMEGPLDAIKMPDALSQRDLRISSVNAKVTYKK